MKEETVGAELLQGKTIAAEIKENLKKEQEIITP